MSNFTVTFAVYSLHFNYDSLLKFLDDIFINLYLRKTGEIVCHITQNLRYVA